MLRRFPRRADALLFVALSLASLALTGTSLITSIGHVGRPFPGFVLWDNTVVVALDRPGWTGTVAAVPIHAQVASVDGHAVASRRAVYDVVRAAPVGSSHQYVFLTPAGALARTVPSMMFSVQDYAVTLGVYVLNGLAFIAIGLAVFYLKPESRQSRALLTFGLLWGLTLVLCPDLFTQGRLGRLAFVFEALAPVALLHFGLTFPEPRAPIKHSVRWLAVLGAGALAVGVAETWMFWRWPRGLLGLVKGVNLALVAAGLVSLGTIAASAFRGATPLARRRARLVLAGSATAFLLPLPALLAFWLVGRPVSFSVLTVTGFIFPLAIGYAIARHDLFEADRFVKLSVAYALITGIVSVGYLATVLLADRLAAGLALTSTPLFPIVFVLLALATIVPLRERVQHAVDRLFYRGRVDYKDTVARATERMTTLLDRGAIVDHVVSTVRDVLFIGHTSVWEVEGESLVCRGGSGPGAQAKPIGGADPGLTRFASLARLLSRDEVEESLHLREQRRELRVLFGTLAATLVIPLLRSGRVAGLVAVGGKASGGPLSADDVDVLRTLADEAAIALANATTVEQLQDAQERLSRAEHLAAIGELSAAVAHGIRNPLAGIRLAAQVGLETVAPSHPVREALNDVLAEVDKLEAQVRGILDFARPFEPRLEPADLRAVIGSVLRTLASRLAASGVEVEVEAPADLPAVYADTAHIGQALQELLVNALEAMTGGGRITIEAAPADNGRRRVRVAVADSGPGVPPEMRDRVFQLFTTTKPTGTGVGLAFVRKIVERHGGTITVEAAGPRGARFILDLPAA